MLEPEYPQTSVKVTFREQLPPKRCPRDNRSRMTRLTGHPMHIRYDALQHVSNRLRPEFDDSYMRLMTFESDLCSMRHVFKCASSKLTMIEIIAVDHNCT